MDHLVRPLLQVELARSQVTFQSRQLKSQNLKGSNLQLNMLVLCKI